MVPCLDGGLGAWRDHAGPAAAPACRITIARHHPARIRGPLP